jgi:hypothetical protein
MNDWSRLAVDPKTTKNSEPKNELHEYKYAPDMAVQGAPIRKRGFTKGFVRRSERTTPSVLDKYLS